MAHPTDANTGQAIYQGAPRVGLRNVGSYQVSGEPWITGSDAQATETVRRYKFPYVTREVSVFHASGDNGTCRVHFTSGSINPDAPFPDGGDTTQIAYVSTADVYSGLHYVDVPAGSTVTFRAKVKEVYITNTDADNTTKYRIMADLTNVPTSRMYHLTGSGHTDWKNPGV